MKNQKSIASLQMIFSIHARERKKEIILHICKLTSGLLLIPYVKTNNNIAHLKANKWFFQLAKEKERNDNAHL
jgi:hypothetical protein